MVSVNLSSVGGPIIVSHCTVQWPVWSILKSATGARVPESQVPNLRPLISRYLTIVIHYYNQWCCETLNGYPKKKRCLQLDFSLNKRYCFCLQLKVSCFLINHWRSFGAECSCYIFLSPFPPSMLHTKTASPQYTCVGNCSSSLLVVT